MYRDVKLHPSHRSSFRHMLVGALSPASSSNPRPTQPLTTDHQWIFLLHCNLEDQQSGPWNTVELIIDRDVVDRCGFLAFPSAATRRLLQFPIHDQDQESLFFLFFLFFRNPFKTPFNLPALKLAPSFSCLFAPSLFFMIPWSGHQVHTLTRGSTNHPLDQQGQKE